LIPPGAIKKDISRPEIAKGDIDLDRAVKSPG
jgi:hypothetical protein